MAAAQQADYLAVPLLDGDHALVQVAEVDERGLLCLLTTRRTALAPCPAPVRPGEIAAAAFTTPGNVASGLWPILGFDQLPSLAGIIDYRGEGLRDFPDHPVHDPAVIEGYLNAWHGLYDWTAFGDLFDRMTRDGVTRP